MPGLPSLIFIFLSTTILFALLIRVVIRYLQERIELDDGAHDAKFGKLVERDRLLSYRVLAALSGFAAVFILQLLFGVEKLYIAIPVSLAAGFACWKGVYAYFARAAAQRRLRFEAKILDLTMGLASGMKAGLAFGQALDAVSRRIGDPMREEILQVLRENRFGADFPTAFENLARRMPCEDMQLLTTSVALTTRSGGSLAEVLEEMSDVIRKRTEFYGRLRNMTAQGRYEALVIALSPLAAFGLFYLIDPELMRPLVQTWIGWCAIGVSATLVWIGYSILRKITNVEV